MLFLENVPFLVKFQKFSLFRQNLSKNCQNLVIFEEGNNADWPYADKEKGKSDDRGGITSTQKVGNFSHGLKFFFVVT